jgi:hypothetical protein
MEGVEGEGEVDRVHGIRPAVGGPALDHDVADVDALGDRGGVQGGCLGSQVKRRSPTSNGAFRRTTSRLQASSPTRTTRASGAMSSGSMP